MEKTVEGECVMGKQRVMYSSQAAAEVLAAMREIARSEEAAVSGGNGRGDGGVCCEPQAGEAAA